MLFNHGRALAIYLDRMGEACQLRNFAPTRYTAAVRGREGFRARSAIRLEIRQLYVRVASRRLIDRESLSADTGRLFYIAYIFILRLPPDALPAFRAPPLDTPTRAQAYLINRIWGPLPPEWGASPGA